MNEAGSVRQEPLPEIPTELDVKMLKNEVNKKLYRIFSIFYVQFVMAESHRKKNNYEFRKMNPTKNAKFCSFFGLRKV